MNKSSEQSEWELPSGSMVKINGHPYWIKGNVIVIGSTAPEQEAVAAHTSGELNSETSENPHIASAQDKARTTSFAKLIADPNAILQPVCTRECHCPLLRTDTEPPQQCPVMPSEGRLGGQLLFELHGPEGETWRIYEDGTYDGFPPGTWIINSACILLNSLRGRIVKLGGTLEPGQ